MMPEMILPGTYIEVRAEGLIRPGPVSISNLGIVGTASRGELPSCGELHKVYTPANIGEARDIFGSPDPFTAPEKDARPLTLVRALELAYANGAQRVFAVRVANTDAAYAKYYLDASGDATATLQAAEKGSDFNDLEIIVGEYSMHLVALANQGNKELERVEQLPSAPMLFQNKLETASRLFKVLEYTGDLERLVPSSETSLDPGKDAVPAKVTINLDDSGNARFLVFTVIKTSEIGSAPSIEINGDDLDNCQFSLKAACGTITFSKVPRRAADLIKVLTHQSSDYDYELNVVLGDDNVDSGPNGFTKRGSVADFFEISRTGEGKVNNGKGVTINGTDASYAIFSLGVQNGILKLRALSPGAWANNMSVTISRYISSLTLTLGRQQETWLEVPADVHKFAEVINGKDSYYNYPKNASTYGASSIVTAQSNGSRGEISESQTLTVPDVKGTDGADVTAEDINSGLAALNEQDVHIIVIAGEGVGINERDMTIILKSHLETSSTDLIRRERIGVIGGSSDELSSLTAPEQEDGRLLYVAPGIQAIDTATGRLVKLPASYTAAAVAGRLSSLDPQESLTNKPINVVGLSCNYNGTELEQLLLGRVLALESRNGATRVVRGITTSTDTAWSQITTRRIVDYARFGVRASANPFIGKLNNARVRQAMKGSVNSFLADMVDREMLISYDLDVTASRDQEIRGIAQITLVLRPVFSIDYIRVVMYLE